MATPDDDELALKGRLIALIDGPDATAATAQPQHVVQPQPSSASDADEESQDADNAGAEDDAAAQPSRRRDRHRIPPWWSGRHVDVTAGDPDADAQLDVQPDADAQPDVQPDADADVQPDADDAGMGDAAAQPSRPSDAQPTKKPHPRLRISSPRTHTGGPQALVDAPAPRMSLLDAYAKVPPRIRTLVVNCTAAAAGYHFGWVQWSSRTFAWIDGHGWLNVSAGFWVGFAGGCELLRRRMRNRVLPVRLLAAMPIASLVAGALLYGTGWTHLELPL